MGDLVTAALVLVGTGFFVLAAVGLLRMPDVYLRMQPATKASTLGAACGLVAFAIHFRELDLVTRAVAGIAFFFLTAPVTAHVIGRAAYRLGVPQWEGTVRDDLRDAGDTDPR